MLKYNDLQWRNAFVLSFSPHLQIAHKTKKLFLLPPITAQLRRSASLHDTPHQILPPLPWALDHCANWRGLKGPIYRQGINNCCCDKYSLPFGYITT